MTDMQYTLYPKGLYECLSRGSQLGVPLYVTEIGCADRSEDDHIRVTHVESFTSQVSPACLQPKRMVEGETPKRILQHQTLITPE